jgi:hypothetical protein
MFLEKNVFFDWLRLSLLAGGLLLPHVAVGQVPGAAAPQRHTQSVYRRRSVDERVKSFAETLNLDPAQQAGVKAVLERQQREARQIQFDQSLSGAERIGRFRALQQDTVSRIRALLNDEQKKKYDPLNHGTTATISQPSVEEWLKATHQ